MPVIIIIHDHVNYLMHVQRSLFIHLPVPGAKVEFNSRDCARLSRKLIISRRISQPSMNGFESPYLHNNVGGGEFQNTLGWILVKSKFPVGIPDF